MNNEFLNLLKELDPDFKKYLEEKITINRESFNKALAELWGLGPDSKAFDVLELSELSKNLWRVLRKYHV